MQGLYAAYSYLQKMHGSRLNGCTDTSAKPSIEETEKCKNLILYFVWFFISTLLM